MSAPHRKAGGLLSRAGTKNFFNSSRMMALAKPSNVRLLLWLVRPFRLCVQSLCRSLEMVNQNFSQRNFLIKIYTISIRCWYDLPNCSMCEPRRRSESLLNAVLLHIASQKKGTSGLLISPTLALVRVRPLLSLFSPWHFSHSHCMVSPIFFCKNTLINKIL